MTSQEPIPKPRTHNDSKGFEASSERLNLDAWMKATTLIGDDLDDRSEDHILRGIE
jgi:hypothetical protein